MRRRRTFGVLIITIAAIIWMWQYNLSVESPVPTSPPPQSTAPTPTTKSSAASALASLVIKGRAPKTGYARTQFGDGWALVGACDMRNIILHRDLTDAVVSSDCKVESGTLADPYTGTVIAFTRGADTSDDIQIDHVVALSDAWQTGAQGLDTSTRILFANDPLELLAVDGNANQAKGDGDAATWLPANKAFRCQYVARQIAVKAKYNLWVTQAEHDAMAHILESCPEEMVPGAV